LHTQYLLTAVARRLNSSSCSSSSGLSKARARRIAVTVAASDSMQRSASTLRISGWSISVLPKAARWAVCQVACSTAARMPLALPSTQSNRVWLTISMIVGTPRPSSPIIRPHVPSNSTSLEALERLPSLSLSRWRRNTLRSPSGVKRGTAKHESPPSACASTRKRSHIGAEQNHLWPVSSYSAAGPPPFTGRAVVVFARTSEPPCFSVIAIPHRAPRFSGVGTKRRSYCSEVNRGIHSSATSGCACSAGTAA